MITTKMPAKFIAEYVKNVLVIRIHPINKYLFCVNENNNLFLPEIITEQDQILSEIDVANFIGIKNFSIPTLKYYSIADEDEDEDEEYKINKCTTINYSHITDLFVKYKKSEKIPAFICRKYLIFINMPHISNLNLLDINKDIIINRENEYKLEFKGWNEFSDITKRLENNSIELYQTVFYKTDRNISRSWS